MGSKRWGTALIAAVVTAGLSLAGYLYSHRAPKLTDKDTIVLADFNNKTGDSDFDQTLRNGLAVELGQSPFLSLVPDQRMHGTLHLMGRPENTPVIGEVAREICERTFSAAVVQGSISRLGSQYVLGLRATNCRTGDVLFDEQVQPAKKDEVLNSLSQVARKFRTKAGESLATIKEHSTPLIEATTPSLQAWKLYSDAFKVAITENNAGAIPLLQRAVQIDPKFALAYAFLARAYADSWQPVLAAENIRKAYELRDRASDSERFFIIVNYHQQLTGNLEEAERTGELWSATYPRDLDAYTLLSFIYQNLGKYEKSAEIAKRAVEMNPSFPPGPTNLAWAYLFLERYADAEKVAAPYDLATPGTGFAFFGNLYAPYVRGQAYLSAHRYTEAVAEFQKVLDHPGIVFADPVRAVARLQLGRTLAPAGDRTKARAAYQDFLTLWKDADSDIRLLKQARTEYVKLN